MKIREYSGPLTVLGAGALGFSLFCIVAAAALVNPETSNVSAIEAQDIVDSAFSNPISTAVALTVVEITAFIPTPTASQTDLPPASATLAPTNTPTRVFITWTPLPPTRTRTAPRRTPTSTPSRVPSRTPTRTPSRTPSASPTFTFTLAPTQTDTALPPSETSTPRPPTVTPVDTPTTPPTVTPAPTSTEPPTATPAEGTQAVP